MNIKFATVVNKIYLVNYSRYYCYFINGFIQMIQKEFYSTFRYLKELYPIFPEIIQRWIKASPFHSLIVLGYLHFNIIFNIHYYFYSF